MMRELDAKGIQGLTYDEDGLVPVVAQERITGQVLMLAWADQAALQASLETDQMTYWSRSRKEQWVKGETSGHTQRLRGLYADCDGDAVLAVVEQEGPACHTGADTCWCTKRAPLATFLGELDQVIRSRGRDAPEGSHTVALLQDPAAAAAKVTEEADEVARVVRGEANEDSLEHEAADLIYHLLVAARSRGVDLEAVVRELAGRHKD